MAARRRRTVGDAGPYNPLLFRDAIGRGREEYCFVWQDNPSVCCATSTGLRPAGGQSLRLLLRKIHLPLHKAGSQGSLCYAKPIYFIKKPIWII